MSTMEQSDVLVIGGGMFGTWLACDAAARGLRVTLCEAREALHQEASLVNQARIHNGYHYPRSILTGLRSRENFERFAEEFPGAVFRDFTHLYAIARHGSQVTAQQFALFCERIGAECADADEHQAACFDPERVEAVFRVKEYAFDAEALRATMAARLVGRGVDVRLRTRVERVSPAGADGIEARLSGGATIRAALVLNCTYAGLNTVCASSGLPKLPLRQELVEIALMRMPDTLGDIGWTIMDGPYCSSLPFPARQARSLYHVRYSVRGAWDEGDGLAPPPDDGSLRAAQVSQVRHMIADGALFVPALRQAEHLGSLWTVRTKLPGSARTDSRPILFRAVAGSPGLYHVMGGKVDNVYDLAPYMEAAIEAAFTGHRAG
ncbi:MAG: FAD-binding oxidoreductase [Flavobacteriales bacterium]|nr:FAD-binding oxidoreductase [Flavobacteriales bacterium]